MKYKKGTFVVVPNMDIIQGKPPELQTLFLWICSYANEDGQCFPSRSALAKRCGISVRTVDKYILQLIEIGILEKTTRIKKGTTQNTSNLYQILSLDTPPRATNSTTPRATLVTVTIPNINNTNLTQIQSPKSAIEVPFNFKEEMEKLINSEWKPNKIMWLYFTKKQFNFTNHAQFKAQMNICRRLAMQLTGYDSDQLNKTMEYCEEKWGEQWSLSAVIKNIQLAIKN